MRLGAGEPHRQHVALAAAARPAQAPPSPPSLPRSPGTTLALNHSSGRSIQSFVGAPNTLNASYRAPARREPLGMVKVLRPGCPGRK
jgi:hypothetical protein